MTIRKRAYLGAAGMMMFLNMAAAPASEPAVDRRADDPVEHE
ncbi:MAG TPA: hypothetical protein VIM11_15355 [Tepidisphaeraceae bacterium]